MGTRALIVGWLRGVAALHTVVVVAGLALWVGGVVLAELAAFVAVLEAASLRGTETVAVLGSAVRGLLAVTGLLLAVALFLRVASLLAVMLLVLRWGAVALLLGVAALLLAVAGGVWVRHVE